VISVRTCTGVISVRTCAGVISVCTRAGVISVLTCTGVISVRTCAGVISVCTCAGVISVCTCAGVISVRTCAGVISVRTCAGVISVRTCAGVISVRTCAGVTNVRTCAGVISVRTCAGAQREDKEDPGGEHRGAPEGRAGVPAEARCQQLWSRRPRVWSHAAGGTGQVQEGPQGTSMQYTIQDWKGIEVCKIGQSSDLDFCEVVQALETLYESKILVLCFSLPAAKNGVRK
jgi:hypothetical protein